MGLFFIRELTESANSLQNSGMAVAKPYRKPVGGEVSEVFGRQSLETRNQGAGRFQSFRESWVWPIPSTKLTGE